MARLVILLAALGFGVIGSVWPLATTPELWQFRERPPEGAPRYDQLENLATFLNGLPPDAPVYVLAGTEVFDWIRYASYPRLLDYLPLQGPSASIRSAAESPVCFVALPAQSGRQAQAAELKARFQPRSAEVVLPSDDFFVVYRLER